MEKSEAPKEAPNNDIFRTYREYVRKFRPLTQAEVEILAKRIQNGDTKARNKLVNHNLRLVLWAARRYRNRGMDYMNIIQEGNIGLIRATENYKLKCKFSHHAVSWIRHTITTAIVNKERTIRIPVEIQQLCNRIHETSTILAFQLKRKPELKEIADEMDIPIAKIVKALNYEKRRDAISIYDSTIPNAEEESSDPLKIIDKISDREGLNPEQTILAKNELQISIRNLITFKEKLALLSKVKKNSMKIEIFMKRYGLNDGLDLENLEKVGRLYSITTRQGVDSIVRRVWSLLKKNGFQENKEWLTHEISRIHLLSEALSLSIEEAFTI